VAWLLDVQTAGFEIGLHNIGDGDFSREEILEGLRIFERTFGHAPTSFSNHVSNPDNLYWLGDRFEWPIRMLYRAFYRLQHHQPAISEGSTPGSAHFWGDAAKRHLRYIRNHTFNGINTLARDPRMPFRVQRKGAFANLWFSSSDGHTITEFRDLLHPKNIDLLEREGGACIVYTHFAEGFVDERGRVDPVFRERIEHLADRPGWFVPVTPLLDHLAAEGGEEDPGFAYRLGLDLRWALDRIRKKLRYGR
jgi:hypothetical protein